MVRGQAQREEGVVQAGRMVPACEVRFPRALFNRPLNISISYKEGVDTMARSGLATLEPYCENDMRLLKRISNSIFRRFNEPIAESDHDDFYSLTNETLWKAYNAYDPDMGTSFDGFLRSCLENKFKSELTRRHRQKRIIDRFAVPLDAVDADGEECSLMDFIPSDSDTFEEAVKGTDGGEYRDRIRQYISRLSNQQVNMLNLLIDGYKPNEIQRILGMSPKGDAENLCTMRSYENVKILF